MLVYQRVPPFFYQRSATQLPPPEVSQRARPNVGSAPRDFPASAARNGWMKQPDEGIGQPNMWKIGHTNLTGLTKNFGFHQQTWESCHNQPQWDSEENIILI